MFIEIWVLIVVGYVVYEYGRDCYRKGANDANEKSRNSRQANIDMLKGGADLAIKFNDMDGYDRRIAELKELGVDYH